MFACYITCVRAVKITNSPASFEGIQAGKALKISWIDSEGPVTITLKNGKEDNLRSYDLVASGQTGSSYVWSIPSTLPADFYALQLNDGTAIPAFSVLFEITGGPPPSSSVISSANALPDSSTAPPPSQTPVLVQSSPALPPKSSHAPVVQTSPEIPPTSNPLLRIPSSSTSKSSESMLSSTSSSRSTSASAPTSNVSHIQGGTNSSRLSKGATAAIMAIGVAILFILFVGVAFRWGRRSSAAVQNQKAEIANGYNVIPKSELDGEEQRKKAELEAGNVYASELPGGNLGVNERTELEGRRRAAELAGEDVVRPADGWTSDRAELDGRRRSTRAEAQASSANPAGEIPSTHDNLEDSFRDNLNQ
ncbi:hypothetical protein VTL71DRAFT_7781 [Oculimacula yallundae]|uniref:Yeast cell wall synthesis Kre9/Knh1-like N-terminal domain-containing protein n=1 Tax=Oculimacula yallundae TaxID=86028 RepID=A0ABR4CXA8_9HELO